MTWRHIFGLCFVFAGVVVCGFTMSCDDKKQERLERLALVLCAGIIGDANGMTKTRATQRRPSGVHQTLEEQG